jgi:hypothetical protein
VASSRVAGAERCPVCQGTRRRAVVAFQRTEIWVDPEPSEFGHISLETPAHGGRDVAHPLQGLELAEARQHGDPLWRRHDCRRET